MSRRRHSPAIRTSSPVARSPEPESETRCSLNGGNADTSLGDQPGKFSYQFAGENTAQHPARMFGTARPIRISRFQFRDTSPSLGFQLGTTTLTPQSRERSANPLQLRVSTPTSSGRRGPAGGGAREPVADGRGQAAAPALRNIETPVMTIQGMNTMKLKKDTRWWFWLYAPQRVTPKPERAFGRTS